ncbi:MAG: TlpA family protein disulfide reductase [Dysgonamonadaceae bacterium]|jgi:thiol-disulfide isomerase/thioredoxin|nr:TlpA family protein disulfide reductase [Dysgonamonadaceae bacterium]
MNYKLLILSALLFGASFLTTSAEEADSLLITLTAPQLKNHLLTLNAYFNGKIYTVDSFITSDQGTGSFHKPINLEEGLYLIYIDSLHYFDVLLSDNQIVHLTIDTTDMIAGTKVEGAPQSVAFSEYARFISLKQKEQAQLFERKRLLQAENRSATETNLQIDSLNREVSAFQQSFSEKYRDQWVGKFCAGLTPVEGPFPHPTSEEEARTEFYFLKDHFLDHIDLKDKRFWWTNYFPSKLTQYLKTQVEQEPDSLAKVAINLVAETLGDSVSTRMMLTTLLNFSTQSEIMGMENIWARLAEEYFFRGYAPWADSTFLKEMASEYRKIRFCRVGMYAQNITLQDSMLQKVNLYDANNDYTLLCFYEPTCGHCQKIIPQVFNDLYKKYKDSGLRVYCVNMLTDRNDWMRFLREHELDGNPDGWTNLWDPDRTSHYWQFFDTSVTPALFLLDKDKKIIAKRLNVEMLDRMLKYYTGK